METPRAFLTAERVRGHLCGSCCDFTTTAATTATTTTAATIITTATATTIIIAIATTMNGVVVDTCGKLVREQALHPDILQLAGRLRIVEF